MPGCVVGLEPVPYRLVLCLAPCWMLCWVLLPLDIVKFLFKNLGLLGVCHGTCKLFKAREMDRVVGSDPREVEGPFPRALGLTERAGLSDELSAMGSQYLLLACCRSWWASLTLRTCLGAHRASATQAILLTESPAPKVRSRVWCSRRWSSWTVRG